MSSVPASALLGTPPGQPLYYSPSLDAKIKHWLLVVVTLVTCMEFLTSYAIGVALPDIQGDLAASFDEGSWVLSIYTTFFLIGLVMSNWMAQRIGYRRYLVAAIGLFAVSSVCCGLSHTLAAMLICRAIMGFAGGCFLVRAQTAINLTSEGKDRQKALTFFALLVVGGARTFGALIGGYITEWYSWRYIFFLNLPFSLAALALIFLFFPDVKADQKQSRLDIVGILLLIGWVAPIQLVLSRGERDNWFSDPMIVSYCILALCCMPVFIWWSLRAANKNPIVDLRIYRHRNFVVGSVYVVILGMMLYGQLYLVRQFLRNIQHYSAFGTGKMQTVNAIAFFVGLVLGAKFMQQVGLKLALAIGAGVFALGMAVWATRLTPYIADTAMLLPLALTGFGAGWQIGPLSALINSQTPNAKLGDGMQLYLFQRQLGGSWGIAILAILVDRQRSFWSARLSEGLNLFSLPAQDAVRQGSIVLHYAGLPLSDAEAASVGVVHGRLLIQSIVNAFVDIYWYQAAVGMSAIAIILLFSRSRVLVAAVRWAVAMVR